MLGIVVEASSIGVFYTYIFPCMQYNRAFVPLFLFLYLDPGFHCHPIRVHVRVGIWGLVYMVETGGVATIIIVPSSPDACPTGVDDRDSTNKGRVSGF